MQVLAGPFRKVLTKLVNSELKRSGKKLYDAGDDNGAYNAVDESCSDVNACHDFPCDPNAVCNHDGPGQHSCECSTGYSGDGTTCADIDGCADSPPQ